MRKQSPGGNGRLSVWTLLAFAFPGIPATLLISPVFGVLPSYYAIHTRVTLAQVGAAFLIARVVDALTDPLVGILSDRTRTRLGARLPWMIVGAVLAIPSAYFLFLPGREAGGLYFLVASFLVLFAWTLMSIPHNAWAAELTDDYDERSRIFGIKNVLASVGGFGFFLLPPLLLPLTGTTEITPATMLAFVILFSILMPLSLVWAAAKAPLHGSEAERVAAPPLSLGAVLRSVVGNKPFLIFFAITTIAGIATGMSTGLTFLYVQDYLKLGNYFFVLGILPAAAAILSTPFWLWLSRHLDKSRAWGVGLLLSAVLGLPILLFAPGIASLGPLLAVVGITSAMQGVTIALPPSVLADIADYEAWKQNTKAAGNYFSILVLLSKVTTAVGSSAALALSGALGYVPRAQGGTGHVMALLIALVVVPTLLTACAAILAFRFPLNRRRLAIIARRLRQREERSLRTQG